MLAAVVTDRIASASLILASSTPPGKLLTIGAIRAHVSSNACPITFTVLVPNEALSINVRTFIPTAPFTEPREHMTRRVASVTRNGDRHQSQRVARSERL